MAGSTDLHHFELGSFRCAVICDGQTRPSISDAYWSFGNVTDEEIAAAYAVYSDAAKHPPAVNSLNILLIDTGSHRVLVDTGNGPGADAEFGKLLERLPAAGVTADDIDTVVITHGHGDHIGANADGQGNATFPNARYVMSAIEWDHWMRQPDDTRRSQLLSIADRIERIAMDAEIMSGIHAIPAPGHTPGQIALLVESGDARLLHAADSFHHPAQLENPGWCLSFDDNPEATVRTRRALLDLAAREEMLVLPYHFAFPGLGRVIASGDGWSWESVSSEERYPEEAPLAPDRGADA